ncbi:MAG: hypothetical protein AMXMBFR4_33090 [Candidatus Hydrogenedentota bacterium]
MDDFNDNTSTGWSKTAGFVASNTMMVDSNTDATVDTILKDDFTDDDHEIRFSYRRTSSNSGDRVSVYARFVDWDNYVRVEFFGDGTCRIIEKASGTATVTDTGTAASTTNTWYDVRIVCDDTSIKAYHKTGTALESEVLSATSAVTTSSKIALTTWANTTADLDNIWLIGDSLSNTTTFAVNNANELTTITESNGTTSFRFDAWGRMTSKERGSYEAEYEYNYRFLLDSATSDFPGEGSVSYEYGADYKRRVMTAGSSTTKYRWDPGFAILAEEESNGSLFKSYVGGTLADIAGSEPAIGTYRYYSHDHLGSSRRLRNQSAVELGRLEHGPFGTPFGEVGSTSTRSYTSLPWDSPAGLYYAPFRYYFVDFARWISRDPIEGPNVYAYARNNPINLTDELGLSTFSSLDACAQDATMAEVVADTIGPITILPMLPLPPRQGYREDRRRKRWEDIEARRQAQQERQRPGPNNLPPLPSDLCEELAKSIAANVKTNPMSAGIMLVIFAALCGPSLRRPGAPGMGVVSCPVPPFGIPESPRQ